MKQDYNEVTSNTHTVSEIKKFVKKMHSYPEVARHINLAKHLMTFMSKPSFCGLLDMEQTIVETESFDMCSDYIEEMMLKREPLINVLRLLILLSITNSGLPEKNFDYLRNELLITYGFGHRVTLKNLKKAGLFKVQEKKGYWPTVKRALQLVVEDTDTANPNDIDYVFSGYAPPSIHLVQHAI